jgi:hypothetical protein
LCRRLRPLRQHSELVPRKLAVTFEFCCRTKKLIVVIICTFAARENSSNLVSGIKDKVDAQP